MQLSEDHIALLAQIKNEWNRAEEDIKTAELVVNKIVFPAIKELRYGGRRLVDALYFITTAPDDHKVRALLDDACFDCHRARHDAIDAATAKIASDIEIMIKRLGYEAILPAYSEFPKLFRELQKVRSKISTSRGKREDREAIYSVIEATDFPTIVKLYNELRASEDMMKAMAKRNRWNEFFGRWGLIITTIGTLFGVLGVILAIR